MDIDGRFSEADVVDLALSLTSLIDEMISEGVSFAQLEDLTVTDQSGHWERSLTFLRAIRSYVDLLDNPHGSSEAINRSNVEVLCERWGHEPPQTPVILAGSTGSRATTRMLMDAVAKLPHGRVVLPGFDFDLSPGIWGSLLAPHSLEEHPQSRFAQFLKLVGLHPNDVLCIGRAPNRARNKLVSLALRPAPVTDQWMTQGPTLGNIRPITSDLSLIEARDAKEEATAISFAIVSEIQDRRSVAVIAPDATLARRITAELSRWNIVPDDSGGVPLSLTPAGRFLRQTARIIDGRRDPVDVIALLKNPMTQHGDGRGAHMRFTQEFELFLRKNAIGSVDRKCLDKFSTARNENASWATWLAEALLSVDTAKVQTLDTVFETHYAVTKAFAGPEGLSFIFANESGQSVQQVFNEFGQVSDRTTTASHFEYLKLLDRALSSESVRTQTAVRPDVMIWGSLEARVQGADTIILGGLNEGEWPKQPSADPWLNRSMRRELELLLPERQIGLAAHDFQQAICTSKVLLSRAKRSNGSDTVPSRWLSRLTNLLDGLDANDGKLALLEMRARGQVFIDHAQNIDRYRGKAVPSIRPSVAPPVEVRPRQFAVTEVQRLVRDPYAVYARRILKLKPLNPLTPEMDALRKGIIFHEILEKYFNPNAHFEDPTAALERLKSIAEPILDAHCFNSTARVGIWNQLEANADWLFNSEVVRRADGIPMKTEVQGSYTLPDTPFVLNGKADRIDRLDSGSLVIYDYKTGTLPTAVTFQHFDRQLVIEAAMAEQGAFEGVPPTPVSHVTHIGVGRSPSERVTGLDGANDLTAIPDQ
ncbi:MAG: double-strand break repair protein AddB, partial [Pseudomonadota bacterium]